MHGVVLAAATVDVPSQTLWWLNRSTGLVLLILLTLVVLLGIVSTGRWLPFKLPAFVSNELHRNVALLTIALLVVHIATAVLDDYVNISPVDALVPFIGDYRPVWLGLGTLAIDLGIASLIAIALRRRLPERAWRAVHAIAYLAWLSAVLHGLGTGTDTKTPWVMWTYAVCVLLVVAAAAGRVAALTPRSQGPRIVALVGLAIVPALIAMWAVRGPLAPGWSSKAQAPESSTAASVVSL